MATIRTASRKMDVSGASAEVLVAVIDGPMDLDHPEFAGAGRRRARGSIPQPASVGNTLAEHGTHVVQSCSASPVHRSRAHDLTCGA